MFNRSRQLLASVIGLAALGIGSMPHGMVDVGGGGIEPNLRYVPARDRKKRRGKGAVAKPKKRPNRLTISKRVRRKHRRAGR